MRRILTVTFMMAFLLCGCGSGSESMDAAVSFRSQLLNTGGCTFQAEVEAQYESYSSTFLLECQYDAATGCLNFTVLQPEAIADISGSIAEDRRTVSFTDTVLEMELLASDKLSPVALPQILAQSWAESYIASVGNDRDYTVAVFQNGYEDDTLKVETWFENGVPVYADVWYQGNQEAGVTISAFCFQK